MYATVSYLLLILNMPLRLEEWLQVYASSATTKKKHL